MKRLYKYVIRLLKWMIAMGTPSCAAIGSRISRSIDGEVSAWDRLMIRLHTFGCEFCARYRRQLLYIHDQIQKTESFEAPGEARMSAAGRKHLKKMLRDANSSH